MNAKVISGVFGGTVANFAREQDDISRYEREIRDCMNRLDALQNSVTNSRQVASAISSVLKGMCASYIGGPALFTDWRVLIDDKGARVLSQDDFKEAIKRDDVTKFG